MTRSWLISRRHPDVTGTCGASDLSSRQVSLPAPVGSDGAPDSPVSWDSTSTTPSTARMRRAATEMSEVSRICPRRVTTPSCTITWMVAEGVEEVGDHRAADLLLDVLVRSQEDLQKVAAADDALQHALVIDHGEPFDAPDGHEPGSLGQGAP